MKLPSWFTGRAFAWSLYDFADTAFSALFITFFFPVFIKVHLGGSEFQIGLAMGLSVLLAALFVPLIGAVSDVTGRRMPILVSTALATAFFSVLAGYSGLILALAFGFLANLTHLISKDVYDAKMIDIVPRASWGSLSGLGVAVGYFGTIASLAIAYPLMRYFGWENAQGIRAMFWEGAAFYVLFSIPLFAFVPDKIRKEGISLFQNIKDGLQKIRETVFHLSHFTPFVRFLLASFFYNNGMNAVIIFLALYAREVIGLDTREFFPVFALMALAAAGGSLLFGKLSDRFGVTKIIRVALVIWILVILTLTFSASPASFIIAGMIGGAVLGAIWTLNRHMVALLSPEEKIAEFFGFEGLTEKFSGVLGPIVFGALVTAYHYNAGLISMLFFIAAGLLLLPRAIRI